MFVLILYLLVLPGDSICQQFGPRSGPMKCQARSGSKLFDTLILFLKEFWEKFILKNIQPTTKKHAKLPSKQRCKCIFFIDHYCLTFLEFCFK